MSNPLKNWLDFSVRLAGRLSAVSTWDRIANRKLRKKRAPLLKMRERKPYYLKFSNEPDLFAPSHRYANYDFRQWFQQYQKYAGYIAKRIRGARFAGPDAAAHTDWVAAFAQNTPENVRLLTQHYYAEGPPQSVASTIGNLLKPDPKLTAMLSRLGVWSQR